MYLIGHVGITIFAFWIVEQFSDYQFNKLFVGIGAMIPDFIDKPMGSIFFSTGRWFGHSLITLTTLFVLSLLFVKGKTFGNYVITKEPYILFSASLMHLILDLPGISATVVFWPFFGPFPTGNQSDFLRGFESRWTQISEIIGFIAIIFVGYAEKWRSYQWRIVVIIILVYFSLFSLFYILLIGF